MTEWRCVVGYEGLYRVSDTGEVRNATTKKHLHGTQKPKGYIRVGLTKNGKRRFHYVHNLVLRAFDRGPEPGEETRHLNDKSDDNDITNLEWGAHLQNEQDKQRNQRKRNGDEREQRLGSAAGEALRKLDDAREAVQDARRHMSAGRYTKARLAAMRLTQLTLGLDGQIAEIGDQRHDIDGTGPYAIKKSLTSISTG